MRARTQNFILISIVVNVYAKAMIALVQLIIKFGMNSCALVHAFLRFVQITTITIRKRVNVNAHLTNVLLDFSGMSKLANANVSLRKLVMM
jgi:hypothetical protein